MLKVKQTTFKNLEYFNNIISIYPNPATNSVNIQIAKGNAKLTVTDLLGQQIFSNRIQNSIQLNTTEWNKGIYFFTVQSGKSSFTQKFIKQ